jgi:hypothetical protein
MPSSLVGLIRSITLPHPPSHQARIVARKPGSAHGPCPHCLHLTGTSAPAETDDPHTPLPLAWLLSWSQPRNRSFLTCASRLPSIDLMGARPRDPLHVLGDRCFRTDLVRIFGPLVWISTGGNKSPSHSIGPDQF